MFIFARAHLATAHHLAAVLNAGQNHQYMSGMLDLSGNGHRYVA